MKRLIIILAFAFLAPSAFAQFTAIRKANGAETDNELLRFDGITGELIQGTGVTLDDAGALSSTSIVLDSAAAIAAFRDLGHTADPTGGAAGMLY